MSQETQRALAIGFMLAVALWLPRYNRKVPRKMPQEYPNCLVIVPPVGMGASVALDEWAKQKGVELRRYDENANLDDAEKWVRQLFDETRGKRPAAALNYQGKVSVVPINDDLLKNLRKAL
ncbi:MAG: hypothetical protein ACO23H_03060 [Alphaproteobacteria bacterium]